MLRVTILALLFLSVVQAQEKDYNTAEKMAALSDLGWLDTGEEAIKRYEYILPRLRSSCIDITTDSRAGDMLYVGHKYVKDSGGSGEETCSSTPRTLTKSCRASNRLTGGQKRL